MHCKVLHCPCSAFKRRTHIYCMYATLLQPNEALPRACNLRVSRHIRRMQRTWCCVKPARLAACCTARWIVIYVPAWLQHPSAWHPGAVCRGQHRSTRTLTAPATPCFAGRSTFRAAPSYPWASMRTRGTIWSAMRRSLATMTPTARNGFGGKAWAM